MFIAVLATQKNVKSYLGIHALAREYWAMIADGTKLKPISQRQLRERLKKSAIHLENLQPLFLRFF